MKSFKGLMAALFFFVAACLLNAAVPEQIPQIVWHVLKIEPGDSQTRALLAGSGFEIIGTTPDGGLKVLATSDQRQRLESLGVKTAILIYDYGRFLAEKNAEAALLAAADEFATGSMGGFFSPEEALAFVDSLIASDIHGIISDTFHIGFSTWENPIWMVRVSGDSDGDENLPQVFYNSLIHSREGMSLMTLLYFLGFIPTLLIDCAEPFTISPPMVVTETKSNHFGGSFSNNSIIRSNCFTILSVTRHK